MKRKNENFIYKSFEQLKAELFPRLVGEEERQSSKWSSSQLGACLADEAIETLLEEQRSDRKSRVQST